MPVKTENNKKPRFSFYTPADFGRVYHFLRSKESNDFIPYERVRFQFALGLHIDFVNNGIQGGFERTCGIWEDESGIVSLVLTEGGSLWEETFLPFAVRTLRQMNYWEECAILQNVSPVKFRMIGKQIIISFACQKMTLPYPLFYRRGVI